MMGLLLITDLNVAVSHIFLHVFFFLHVDGVFERQLDAALWSGRAAAAGDAAGKLIQSDSIQRQVSRKHHSSEQKHVHGSVALKCSCPAVSLTSTVNQLIIHQ